MNKKYIGYSVLVAMVILGWNVFLIKRDKELFRVYNKGQGIEHSK